MKFIALIIILTNGLFATEVWLKINHNVKGQEYVKNDGVYNINTFETKFKRLQYYLSDIVLIDLNGNRVPAPNLFHLIDSDSSKYFLGDVNIENIRQIDYYFGLSNSINHGDPSVWPQGHPLNLTYAAMHWGWAAGYRFLAVEGYTKDMFGAWKNEFQYHLVGDQYYSKMNISFMPNVSEDGTITINLEADFNELFNGVNLITDNFNHGSGGSNDIIANNVKNGKFLSYHLLSVDKPYPNLSIYPNPSQDFTYINFDDTNITGLTFKLTNIKGEFISEINPLFSNKIDLSNLTNGIYFLNVIENEKVVKMLKIVK